MTLYRGKKEILVVFVLFLALFARAQPDCRGALNHSSIAAVQIKWIQSARDPIERLARCRRFRRSVPINQSLFSGASWVELMEIADHELKSCLPQHFSNLLADSILHHPASFATRRETVLENLTRPSRFTTRDYLDEVLGISDHRLWQKEKSLATKRRIPPDHIYGVGVGPNWFSRFMKLTQVAEYAQANRLKTIVDLGCGTGRLGLLIGFLFPELNFKGIELQTNRVEAARAAIERWGLTDRIQVVRQDLLDTTHPLPEADVYYIYGPTNDNEINAKVLERVRERQRSVQIISTLARTSRLLDRAEWAQKRYAVPFSVYTALGRD